MVFEHTGIFNRNSFTKLFFFKSLCFYLQMDNHTYNNLNQMCLSDRTLKALSSPLEANFEWTFKLLKTGI